MALGKTAKSILKWAVYSFVLLLLYTLQASPALFSIHGIKPVFVIPMAVSVALFENEAGAGAFGLAAGLLWDFSAGKLFGTYRAETERLRTIDTLIIACHYLEFIGQRDFIVIVQAVDDGKVDTELVENICVETHLREVCHTQ